MARLSRQRTGGFCRTGTIDSCSECRVPLPRRRDQQTLGPIAATAFAPGDRASCATERLAEHCLRHHGQCELRQQLYPRGLSAVPAETPLGLAQHALLAQTRVREGLTNEMMATLSAFSARWRATGLFSFVGCCRLKPCSWRRAPAPSHRAEGTCCPCRRPEIKRKVDLCIKKHGETPEHVKNATARSSTATGACADRA